MWGRHHRFRLSINSHPDRDYGEIVGIVRVVVGAEDLIQSLMCMAEVMATQN